MNCSVIMWYILDHYRKKFMQYVVCDLCYWTIALCFVNGFSVNIVFHYNERLYWMVHGYLYSLVCNCVPLQFRSHWNLWRLASLIFCEMYSNGFVQHRCWNRRGQWDQLHSLMGQTISHLIIEHKQPTNYPRVPQLINHVCPVPICKLCSLAKLVVDLHVYSKYRCQVQTRALRAHVPFRLQKYLQ